ncbi:MAG: DoxX family protein [Nitrososphaerota archaeon]|nr:DoxX family protein [Nitrososphaerota archaeon]MDG6974225.1 DoxX family protein [Nitrososphaerota archaeon]MDG7025112.1 DoxX family protein [Nitrososphaerota archaeon]
MSSLIGADYVALFVRVFVGAALIAHAIPKVKGGWGTQAGQWIGSMGVPPVAARFVTTLEFFGGLFLIVGLLVPVVAAFFTIQFVAIIAMKATKMKAGFMAAGDKPGYEIDFTYLLLSLAIFLLGSGALSVDGLLHIL